MSVWNVKLEHKHKRSCDNLTCLIIFHNKWYFIVYNCSHQNMKIINKSKLSFPLSVFKQRKHEPKRKKLSSVLWTKIPDRVYWCDHEEGLVSCYSWKINTTAKSISITYSNELTNFSLQKKYARHSIKERCHY